VCLCVYDTRVYYRITKPSSIAPPPAPAPAGTQTQTAGSVKTSLDTTTPTGTLCLSRQESVSKRRDHSHMPTIRFLYVAMDAYTHETHPSDTPAPLLHRHHQHTKREEEDEQRGTRDADVYDLADVYYLRTERQLMHEWALIQTEQEPRVIYRDRIIYMDKPSAASTQYPSTHYQAAQLPVQRAAPVYQHTQERMGVEKGDMAPLSYQPRPSVSYSYQQPLTYRYALARRN
jgi:hypothetical protein